MPGVASIHWNESNLAKALHAMIGRGCIKLTEEDTKEIAAYLGGTCTDKAIRSLLVTRKSSYKGPAASPAASSDTTDAAPKIARKRKGTTTAPKSVKARKTSKSQAVVANTSDEDEDEETSGLATPPSSEIKRESPRKKATVDYKSLAGQIDGTVDEIKEEHVSSGDESGDDFKPTL